MAALGIQQHAAGAVADAEAGQAHPLVVQDGEGLIVAGEAGEGHHEVVIGAGQGDPAAVDEAVRPEVLAEGHGDLRASVRGHGHLLGGGAGGRLGRVELGIAGRDRGRDAALEADVVHLLGVGVVGDRQGDVLRPGLALAEGDRRGRDGRGRVHRGDHVQHARALTVDGLEIALLRQQRPGELVGGVHHRGLHVRGGEVGLRLQQQRGRAGDVRRRHRRAGHGAVAAALERQRRPDRASGRGDVGLEVEVGGQAVGGEVGDETAGPVLDRGGAGLPGPGDRAGRERLLQGQAVGLGEHHDRDGERGIALDRRVQGTGGVVVQDHGVVAGLLAGDRLLAERAGAALDEQGLARLGGRHGRRVAGLRGGGAGSAGGDEGELARGRRLRRAGRGRVGPVGPARGREGRGAVGVVDGGDGDRALGHARGAAREQARGPLVARGDDHGDVVVDERLDHLRGRVVLPGHEGGAEGHVDHVRAVVHRPLHRLEDHLGVAGALAAEHAVGEQVDLRGHADDLAVGADDAGDVGAVAAAVVGELVGDGGLAGAGVVGVADEVVAADDAVVREVLRLVVHAGAAEIGMVVVDAGVDHRDGDALAAEAVDLLDLVHAGHRVAVDVRGRRIGRLGGGDLEHGVHGPHALDLAELLRIGVVHLDGHAVPAGGEVLLDLERDRGVLGALGHGLLRGGRRRLRAAAERGLPLDLDQPAAGDGRLPRGAELVGRGDLDAELGGGGELLGGLAVGERGGAHQHAGDERRAGGGREQAAGSGKIWSGQRHRRRPSRREGGRCAREGSPRGCPVRTAAHHFTM